MKEPRYDDERLSALLAQRLDEREREEMLAHLSTSDDDRRIFADTAAILHELEAEAAGTAADPEPAKVVPLRPRKPKKPVLVAWGAIAAVLAALALLPVLGPRAGAAGDPMRLAARAVPAGEGLPPSWSDSRGGGSDTLGAVEPRAARAGALMVQLVVAVRARDDLETRRISDQLEGFGVMGARASLREISDRAEEPPDSLAPLLERAAERLSARLDADYLGLGAWTEAARLAADRENEAFFRDRETRVMLDRAERITRNAPAAQPVVARVRAAVEADPVAWEALRAELEALRRAITTWAK